MQYWRKPPHVELNPYHPLKTKVRDDHIAHDDIDNHVPNNSNHNSTNIHSSTGLHRITIISIPMPIVAVQLITVDHHATNEIHNPTTDFNDDAITGTTTARAALLEANDGVIILDCDLLVRSGTNTLTEHDRQQLMRNEDDDNNNDDDDPNIIPLDEIMYNQSYVTFQLMKITLPTSSVSLMIPSLILAMDWLVT
jgi:hypothetical protein